MILYPAVDLLAGQVVRLVEGDFAQKTVFTSSPQELFAQFYAAGAKYAHLVDLSGARNPRDRQKDVLKSVLQSTPLKVQLGGGIRTLQEMSELLELGADRVVLGSLVATQPEIAMAALREFGKERITFALDVRIQNGEPMVMTQGWTEASGLTLAQALAPFLEQGVERILCTDIAVDGRLTGPNVELYKTLTEAYPQIQIQASGGVESLNDLKTLAQTQTHSVVVGRALLSGKININEALENVK